MTKAEIVAQIAQKTGIEKVAIQATVEEFMNVVKESLAEGENVYLRFIWSSWLKTSSMALLTLMLNRLSLILAERLVCEIWIITKLMAAKANKVESNIRKWRFIVKYMLVVYNAVQ